MTYLVKAGFAARAPQGTTTRPKVVKQQTRVEQSTTVTRRSEGRSHLLKDPDDWGWSEVRDYVVRQIEDRFGEFPRDHRKEASIFKGFCNRYGAAAPLIAQYAFDICDGWWKGSPVHVNRFTKNSDPYFGDLIISALSD